MEFQQGLEWTFDTEAEKYEKMRPGYPAELYNDIFNKININSDSNVLEIGIGGGQAALPILKTGCRLTAVEYGENLANVCRKKFQSFPKFSAIVGKFEDVTLDKNSYDLIYSASAFHWIPEEIGYKKVYELLKHGGVFARFANHPYKDKGREELDEKIQKLYSKYMDGTKRANEFDDESAKNRSNIAKKYGFTELEYHLYHRTRTFTSKEYIELLGTYSDHIAIEENTRKKFFTEIEEAIDQFGGKISIYDAIDLELAREL